ncbi:MAG TPA: NAD(P)-dependent oxidoreductase [Longimicrobium sp.]
MKAFVTGGTGFVGTPFVRRLVADGWEVAMITRGGEPGTRADGVRVYRGEISDPATVAAIAEREASFDTVFHLAASMAYFGRDEELRHANVEGTRNALALARSTGARRFVYASSIEAVGTVDRVPAPADAPCRPVSSYGRSKVLAEDLIRRESDGHFGHGIVRIGNVYASDHGSFVLEIAEALLTRNRLLEFLPSYADRCIQPAHNADVTEGLLAAARAESPAATATLAGEWVTMGDLFEMCATAMGRIVPPRAERRGDAFYLRVRARYHRRKRQMDLITYLMNGRGRRVHRAYDLEHAREVFGFTPRVQLRTGVAECLAWARGAGMIDG